MKSLLLVSTLCFSLLFSHLAQAEEPVQPEEAPKLVLPPSGRGMALAGGVLSTWAAGGLLLGVYGAAYTAGCHNPYGCESEFVMGSLYMGAGLGSGVVLAAVGGPIMGVGVRRMLAYKDALRAGLRDPRLQEEARRQIARDMRVERIGMIASGVIFGLTSAATIATGIALGVNKDSYFGEYGNIAAGSIVSGVGAAGSLFALAFCGANYQAYKALLAGTDTTPLLSSLSVAPVVSSSMYGLSLSGKW